MNRHLHLLLLALAATTTACGESKPQDIRLVISDEGQYVLEGKAVAASDLRAQLRALKAQRTKFELHVIGSPNAKYEHIAGAMKVVQEEGLARDALLTEPPPRATSAPASGSR